MRGLARQGDEAKAYPGQRKLPGSNKLSDEARRCLARRGWARRGAAWQGKGAQAHAQWRKPLCISTQGGVLW